MAYLKITRCKVCAKIAYDLLSAAFAPPQLHHEVERGGPAQRLRVQGALLPARGQVLGGGADDAEQGHSRHLAHLRWVGQKFSEI